MYIQTHRYILLHLLYLNNLDNYQYYHHQETNYIIDRNNTTFLDILYENLLIREPNIDYNIITYYINNPIKFTALFNKYDKSEDNIRILLAHGVSTNNLEFIKSTYIIS